MSRRCLIVGVFLAGACILAPAARCGELSAPLEDEARAMALANAMSCAPEVLDALDAEHRGSNVEGTAPASGTQSVLCELARDALCASRPDAPSCETRAPRGAYGGYYLARHALPLVAWLRAELNSRDARDALVDHALAGLTRILDLLEPGLDGCRGAPGLRTWCTVDEGRRDAVSSHRYLVAYFASEVVRILAECRALELGCPGDPEVMERRLALWFDVLAWDHVFMDTVGLRNSQTQRIASGGYAQIRFQLLRSSLADSPERAPPVLFQVEGWSLALAANLLAVDALLKTPTDPRRQSLTDVQLAVLGHVVKDGVEAIGERLAPTTVYDLEGQPTEGGLYDMYRWDAHPYWRFSSVTGKDRPFTVTPAQGSGPPALRFTAGTEARARGAGHDSGHYRRLVWLHYTLFQTARHLDEDWTDEETLGALANQFAYAVYRHPCASGTCSIPVTGSDPPRFANYASGVDGWYRLMADAPCSPGVPPSGFSTQMLLSENLWWSRFNPDVLAVWRRLDAAARDATLRPPSRGDVTPCGEEAGKRVWHRSYHEVFWKGPGTLSYHGAAFVAMQRWAALMSLP